jgi:hypothetical protein
LPDAFRLKVSANLKFIDRYSNTLLVTFNNRIYLGNQHGDVHAVPSLEARSAPTPSISHPITINASRTYGAGSHKIERFSGDRDIEIGIHPHTV